MPRLRVHLRTLLIGVAVPGSVLAMIAEGQRRRDLFRRLADGHRSTARSYDDAHGCWHVAPWPSEADRLAAEETRMAARARIKASPAGYRLRVADYFWSLAKKYESAARYPWLPVTPDPPLPK